jgi:hypothetical protein
MDLLVFGPAEKEAIKKLIEYAKDNPFSVEFLEQHNQPPDEKTGRTKSNQESVDVGAKYTISFVGGVNVTYTHEEQPTAWCRHMSISSVGTYPSLALVEMLMAEFGFVNKHVRDVAGWLEDLMDDRVAVNVLEPLDGDMERITAKHDV